jgi:hypothetical protein
MPDKCQKSVKKHQVSLKKRQAGFFINHFYTKIALIRTFSGYFRQNTISLKTAI